MGNRYQALLDEVKIGPVVAPNRFYQVPHCTGMGYGFPNTLAAMREMKAEDTHVFDLADLVSSLDTGGQA